MLKSIAFVFGAVLLLVGILGLIPAITANGLLLGIFAVDTLHNIVHLLSGAVIIFAALNSDAAASMALKIFGVIYALVTIVGFVQESTVLGLLTVNLADNILHLVIALVALIVGFAVKPQE
ncbi:MAG: hypothetical protein A2V81_00635 [Candidatus Abawacabacteria bacterium RBG_16_42_10]|uniref:DUF4383 domain-containing protein n=1 Tax=Candidatus Abawacabacteria bacterium RBG_16_42_10 TaxID=1817814 RepID=A0A1F4XKT5_9BACT|nr:MAG: hypothetical protein A2V81_00635 [Candidatus Abawacabacteria bacterium RBG_16_42_10]